MAGVLTVGTRAAVYNLSGGVLSAGRESIPQLGAINQTGGSNLAGSLTIDAARERRASGTDEQG